MAHDTKLVNSYFTQVEISSENPTSIRAQLQSWAIGVGVPPGSALTAEKFGDEWFLSIPLVNSYGFKSLLRFPARDITINGKPLGRFLEAIATTSS